MVGQVLDGLDLFGCDAFEMGEVEAEAIRFHQRTGLANVISQDLAQGPVQDMGGGVVALHVVEESA